MAAGKTMVGGTEYEITAGKTMDNGTAYDITAGKTMDGGTTYDIAFAPEPVVMVIKLSGIFNQFYGYVTVGGHRYTSGVTITYTIPPDTAPSITVYCGSQSTNMAAYCNIKKDGVTVKTGAGSYTFTADGSYNITMNRYGSNSSNYYYTATIVSA